MKSFKKLLNKNNIVIGFLTAVIFVSCGEEKPKDGYLARVNDTYLSAEEFENLSKLSSLKGKFREEIIRQWIEKELLYQEAKSEGITDEVEYKRIIENSRKELAASFLLKKIIDDASFNFETEDVKKFYENNKQLFTSRQKTFLINKVEFEDEDQAIQFRTTAVESDWYKAVNAFSGDSVFLSSVINSLFTENDFFSARSFRLVNGLSANEISIVFENENHHYEVLQLLQSYETGELMPFEAARNIVEAEYLAVKREEIIDAYLKDLYSNNEIEIIYGK